MTQGTIVVPLRPTSSAKASELPDRSDDELIVLAGAGAVEPFAELVRRYQRRVRDYCAKWCGSKAQGEDLAQEVFWDVWNARERYRPEGKFISYLFTLVRNRCVNATRTRRKTVEPPDTLAVSAEQLDGILEQERRRRVVAEIARLPPKLREAVLLRFEQGLGYPQIAGLVGAPQATMRSRVFLGLAELRDRLGGGAA